MGILDFFKGTPPSPSPEDQENPSLRKIMAALEALPKEEAKHIAAFAYILGRVAHADLEISEEETGKMEEIVRGFTDISPDLAILLVQIAKSQNVLFGSTDNYLVVREFKKMSEKNQREGLLHCLFAVAGSDDNISNVENEEIRKITTELGFTQKEFIEIRLHYRDKLAILKNLPS